MGLARIAGVGALGVAATAAPVARALGGRGAPWVQDGDGTLHVELWADRDDDDADGRPDGEESPAPPLALVDAAAWDRRLAGALVQAVSGGDHVRIVLGDGNPLPSWGRVVPRGAWLQGLSPGHAELLATAGSMHRRISIDVGAITLRGGDGRDVDLTRSHASLDRTPPARIAGGPDAPYDDVDALRLVVIVPTAWADLPDVAVESLSAVGVRLDVLARVALSPVACPAADAGLRCLASVPLRFAMDDVDRTHPLVADRSIKAQVGGAIVLRVAGRKAQMIRVLGPRSSAVGPIGRLRATVRPIVVRVAAGGAPAIGGTDAGAVEALRAELGAASAIWGQCGLTFGDTRTLEVKVIDPPPSHLVAVGDGLGIPASGGEIHLRADGKAIGVTTSRGESVDQVARDIARAAERAGLVAVLSSNSRIGPALGSSVDVSLRRKDGTLVAVDAPADRPMSTDSTLSLRIGSVDMSDGLQHFTDVDAMAGTLEERTLLKAVDDGNPATLEVVVIPLFAGGGRIGESFIGSDLSSLRNVVLLDRAGIRARKSSLTLAHELGHVLMDLPGHPDDYGVDTPTQLMDSDAADPSPFGPRRLTLEECARVVRQSGPGARMPLLAPWPIGPLPAADR